jgi:hypothetical protein
MYPAYALNACKNGARTRGTGSFARGRMKKACGSTAKTGQIGNQSDLARRKIDLRLLHIGQNGSNLAPSWCGPGRFPLHLTLTLNLLR